MIAKFTFLGRGLCRRGLCIAVFVCILPLCGCWQETLPQGTVATVNGRPIALRTLQTMQDTRTAGLGAFEKPSLASLRHQYGKALFTLIAHEMVLQELEKLDMSVSEAAIQEAEMRVRQDYPDEELEKVLAESAIDMHAWRELMRYRIALILFSDHVLRPSLVVPLEEVQSYFAAQQKAFVIARQWTLYQVMGEDKDKLENLRRENDIPENGEDVQVFRLTMNRTALPPQWEKKLRNIKMGECTQVTAVDAHFEFVCLVSETAERSMTIAEAYPYIEEILLEEKLDTAFQQWLEKTMPQTKVHVSTHLVEEMRKESP